MKKHSTNSVFWAIMLIVPSCARSPVDRTLASGAESVGSTPAERTILIECPADFPWGFFFTKIGKRILIDGEEYLHLKGFLFFVRR